MALKKVEHFGMARKIVSNMTAESWETIPHACMTYEPEATKFIEVCKNINKGNTDPSKKITINTIMLKVICEGFKAAPKLNSHLEFNRKLVRGCLKTYDHVDISMPMILPSGEMMTINLHDMDEKSLTEMTETINDSVRRAKNTNMTEVMLDVSVDNTIQALKRGEVIKTIHRIVGTKTGKHKVQSLSGKAKKEYYSIPEEDRLTLHDIEQGTTTISNLGSIYRDHKGVCTLLEIIPPQVTAFAVNSIQTKPIVVKDENGNETVKVGHTFPITIAIDHKALDYGDVVPFMQRLDEIFANPEVINSWI